MYRVSGIQRWLIGAALGALAAVLVAPASSWLVRNQLGLILGGRSTEVSTLPAVERARPADSMPNDLQIQLAAAFSRNTDVLERTEGLRKLKERFGDQPALYATILRSAAGGDAAAIYRDELHLLEGNVPRKVTLRPQREQRVANFDADAARGEELEPDNAYFPLLRSASLFASRRDEEALAAISRAASKSKWEEYVQDEAIGKLRLSEAAYGRPPAIVKTALFAAILFPHYAVVRNSARMAVYNAVEAEKSGDFEKGTRIRSDLVRIGDRMRADGRSLITALVGRAITSLSMVRPGGGPVDKRHGESAEDQSKRNREAYSAFLRAHGHSAEADYFLSALAAGDGIKEKIQPAIDESAFGGKPMWRLLGFWAANLLLLGNAIWILLLGGAAAIAARTRSIREGRPLAAEVKWPIWVGILLSGIPLTMLSNTSNQGFLEGLGLAVLGAVTYLLTREWNIARALPFELGLAYAGYRNWLPLPLLLSVGMLALGVLLIRQIAAKPASAMRIMMTGATSMLCVTGLGNLLLWQTHGFRELGSIWGALGDGSDPRVMAEITSGAFLLIPVLLVGLLAVVSLVNRVPASVGVTRGIRGLAAPAACLLALAYCGTLLGTLRMEKFVDDGLNLTLQHEGRYIYGIFGEEWPGLVPPPDRAAERKESAE